ncbi:4-oxalocrotonate decarboxylase [Caballeronia udeis]|uniref:4-oxalocrotonate decarboxylase n=1 Tax=Caballeronia udeis TaxID=1232866 RepID=A0A158JII7_9BURK|nr:hypothetical protein [Caballeronia udeis]SAL68648.1 4-oxalocrotonate decarboxylase [Caballeronia udeis]
MNQDHIAKRLDAAALGGHRIAPIEGAANIAMGDAYALQAATFGFRLKRGEFPVGTRTGCAGLDESGRIRTTEAVVGRLASGMQISNGESFGLPTGSRVRAEPALALLLRRPVGGNCSDLDLIGAIEAVAVAIELFDSRYEAAEFTMQELIADNAGLSRFVTGPWRAPRGHFTNLGVTLEIDGHVAQFGSTATLGIESMQPLLQALRLANTPDLLPASSIVLLGGATPAQRITPGQHVGAGIEGLGHAGLTIKDDK